MGKPDVLLLPVLCSLAGALPLGCGAPAAPADLAGSADLAGPAAPPDLAPEPPRFALLLSRLGDGVGEVSGDGFGLRCGDSCAARVPAGSEVTLTATVDERSSFVGWGGACSGRALRCTLRIAADTAVSATFGRPRGCDDVQASRAVVTDGTFVLFADGNPGRPYQARCEFGDRPAAYLELKETMNGNFSQYTAGGGRLGNSVRTTYQRVRIDPATLLVDVTDRKYALSVGRVSGSGATITEMDYGSAGDCRSTNSQEGVGNIDLRGLPFRVAPSAFVTTGFQAAGGATYSADDQVVSLRGGGFCGGTAVRSGPMAPFILQLVYKP